MQLVLKQRIMNKNYELRTNKTNPIYGEPVEPTKPISMKAFKNAFSAFGIWFFVYNNRRIIKGNQIMRKTALILILTTVMATGCVERELTINTQPQGAVVTLNDEEIGTSPVTVSFNWYGDYCVRISKEGYETLNTHRELAGPWYDSFPFDFFAQIASAKRTVDKYEWTFTLEEKKQITQQELVEKAQQLRNQLQ